MRRTTILARARTVLAACLVWTMVGPEPARAAAPAIDETPRTAVISAFAPELDAILARTKVERRVEVNGIAFSIGRLGGAPVVVFASGVSMVNATMAAQIALDRFAVTRIVFTGIAGGVDPSLSVGDVSVPERWGQYLEAIYARETPDGFRPPPWAATPFASYGMAFPQEVRLRDATHPEGARTFWLAADPAMLAHVRRVASDAKLATCARSGACLSHTPRVIVGGNGVSGSAFVDNAAFRQYVSATFGAQVLDMESAAVAAVAYSNKVPYLALRSVSDLAGGGAGENEMATFMSLAATNAAALLETFLAEPRP